MNLAEDRRARVPFALVGVLLLVASAGLSATLTGGPAPRTDDSVRVALDRATAATNTALRGAVARAGRQAAGAPVIAPADTDVGRVLNDSTPFRDYLRVRIALAAREALAGTDVEIGGARTTSVDASVSLPPIRSTADLRRAKRGVAIEPAGGPGADQSAGLRVRIENVTVTATRAGRTVDRERLSPTLVAATPALALHERVRRFESRLNRGPLAPGLGRRLTGRLHAVAWARGYAQFGRAPVENVVANRHVELAANGALLREQRVAFGRSDPAARRAVGWAAARVGVTDLLAAANARGGSVWTEGLLRAARRYQSENPLPGGMVADRNATGGDASRARLRVGVNRTADRAFVGLVAGENGTGLDDLLRSSYTIDARLVAAVREVDGASGSRPSPASPGGNWTLRDTEVRTTTAVDGTGDAPPPTPRGWHLLRHEARRVVQGHRLVADWVRGNETRRTVRRWTETYAVRVGVAGDHGAEFEGLPSRPVAGVHERGRALDGPNLRGAADAAAERLVESRGGVDALARRAVAGTLDTRTREVSGRRPPNLREWVYRDLVALRERLRNVSVTVSRARAVGGTPPAAELADRVRAERAVLLDAPARYAGVADRARVAARAAYLDRVVDRLEARADRTAATRTGVDRALADAGASLDRARRILRQWKSSGPSFARTPAARSIPAEGPGRALDLRVSGAPPYLTLAALDHEQVTAIPEEEQVTPLAARNVNVFAVPYGDAAETVASALAGSGESARSDLRTAARALRAANRTLAETDNQSLADRRDALQDSLSSSTDEVRRRLVGALAMSRFDLPEAERRAAVDDGLARWNATHARALAVANGSAARAVATALLRGRPALRRPDRRDWVRLRAELATESVRRSAAGPPRSRVNRTASTTRAVAEAALRRTVTSGLGNATEVASKRWFGEVLGAVPAGLPVAPVPGYWYATVNVWTVSVRGEYARFAVGAPQGPPGESVTYVREAGNVTLDWDGDGRAERIGRTTPVSFRTETVVAVVVPPGPPGVGDRDGNRDERSSGWSSG